MKYLFAYRGACIKTIPIEKLSTILLKEDEQVFAKCLPKPMLLLFQRSLVGKANYLGSAKADAPSPCKRNQVIKMKRELKDHRSER